MAASAKSFAAFFWNSFLILTGISYILQRLKSAGQHIKRAFYDVEEHRLQALLKDAASYNEWLQAAQALDEYVPGNLDWKLDPKYDLYHWRQIEQRIVDIQDALREVNLHTAYILLQFGMVRGLGNIADLRLYTRVYSGTKAMIEAYISTMLTLVDIFFEGSWNGKAPSLQAKYDHAERFRIAFGKTGLVLQGGSIFGLYHIGVMKALQERGLLPKVIVGTGTGAIMAALVGIHTDEELPEFLRGRGINLDAFDGRGHSAPPSWMKLVAILFKRLRRYYQSGYVLDRQALEQCVEDSVGDMTFRQAYERSGRIISISIEGDAPGTPNCLNYLTTPHVLIRTAAMASNESDPDVAPGMILQRYPGSEIEPWSLNDESPTFRKIRRKREKQKLVRDETEAPLMRISQLENVNHFIVSQARPYMLPIVSPDLAPSNTPRNRRVGIWRFLVWKDYFYLNLRREITHRLHMFDRIWGLRPSLRRFLLDEKIPFRSVTLVPEVRATDFLRLLRNPTSAEIDHWISLGEKSVWPCVAALHVRCDIEFALEERFKVEPRRPLNQIYAAEQALLASGMLTNARSSRRRTRARSASAASNPT